MDKHIRGDGGHERIIERLRLNERRRENNITRETDPKSERERIRGGVKERRKEKEGRSKGMRE